MNPTLYRRVEQAVHGYNPDGLLSTGAPDDEFEGEILEIVELLNRHKVLLRDDIDNVVPPKLKTVTLIVKFVFDLNFGPDERRQGIVDKVVAKILDPSIKVIPVRPSLV